MDIAEEKALVRRLARMEDLAWTLFCREYSQPLLQFAQVCLGCRGERAEEVVQMTFVRCVRSIGTFDPNKGRFFAWLKAIARHEAYASLRQNCPGNPGAVRVSISDEAGREWLARVDQNPLPEDLLVRQDVQLLVQEILAEMNTRQRDVLVAKYVDGDKVTHIAAKMRVSEKTVESLLTRARESFRAIIAAKLRGRDEEAFTLDRT